MFYIKGFFMSYEYTIKQEKACCKLLQLVKTYVLGDL